MNRRVILSFVFLAIIVLPSTADALRVTRTRKTIEPITVDKLLRSLASGAGLKITRGALEKDGESVKAKLDRLNIKFEAMSILLRDRQGKERGYAVKFGDGEMTIELEKSDEGFSIEDWYHFSQTSTLWANTQGRRVHFQQELEYNPQAGFVQLDLKVLNSIDRISGLDYSVYAYETGTDVESTVKQSLSVSVCVPGRPCGLIHRYASRKIACKSDQALKTLDAKVREIVRDPAQGWLDLVPVLAERALGSSR